MSSGVVQLQDVLKMLDECLPGYTKRTHGDQRWIVMAQGKSCPYLPTGAHGRAQLDREGVREAQGSAA